MICTKKIETLEQKHQQLKMSNNELRDKNSQLCARVEALTNSMDDIEQYSRNSNLLIHGVPAITTTGNSEDGLVNHIVQLLNTHMGTTLREDDITTIHRIGRSTVAAGATGTQQDRWLYHDGSQL
jgi:hypothetical protein